MKSWQDTLVPPTATMHATIQAIDSSSLQIALITAPDHTFLGTVTDGDIRRAILKGLPLDTQVRHIMNHRAVTVPEQLTSQEMLAFMRVNKVYRLPVLNEHGQVTGLAVLDELLTPTARPNFVVLMAGGLGTRLRPLTNSQPKPLLKVGSKPVLQTIIENFREQGFRDFYISVNYKAQMIEDYFGNGAQFDVKITYLHENQRMGTAGALSLLPEPPTHPLLVMNGDLLTKVDYRHLLDFHVSHRSQATMCVREYDFQVPYGVVEIDKHRIVGIKEKPLQRFFVNAGIYVLEPQTLAYIPANQFYDMPTLFEHLINEGQETCVFPIREYWIDIGHKADLERANLEFEEIFA